MSIEIIQRLVPEKDKNGKLRTFIKARCMYCNNIFKVRSDSIKQANSCGCMKGNKKHGKAKTRIYRIWAGIKTRCLNNKSWNYGNYGGRGITVCDKWLKFLPFYEWAVKNGYQEELQIDRIDNNCGYMPSNCRFVTFSKNNQNRRSTKLTETNIITIKQMLGSGLTQKIIAKTFDVDRSLIGKIKNNRNWRNINA